MKDGLRKYIRQQVAKTLLEYDNYNYPAGADADPSAPWNQEDEPEAATSKNDFVDLLWYSAGDEVALVKEKATGQVYVFNFIGIDKEDFGEFGSVPYEEDADEDGKYSYPNYDDWEVDGHAIENYANEYWQHLTKGVGYNDYERGNTHLATLDKEIVRDLIDTFGEEVRKALSK